MKKFIFTVIAIGIMAIFNINLTYSDVIVKGACSTCTVSTDGGGTTTLEITCDGNTDKCLTIHNDGTYSTHNCECIVAPPGHFSPVAIAPPGFPISNNATNRVIPPVQIIKAGKVDIIKEKERTTVIMHDAQIVN